jgi:hypothetical protein
MVRIENLLLESIQYYLASGDDDLADAIATVLAHASRPAPQNTEPAPVSMQLRHRLVKRPVGFGTGDGLETFRNATAARVQRAYSARKSCPRGSVPREYNARPLPRTEGLPFGLRPSPVFRPATFTQTQGKESEI